MPRVMMQRVMILGQPGSGKSTLARRLGARTGLPVFHMDHIHWLPGWVERPQAEKIALAHAIEARAEWIFEGGLSATYDTRAARADLVIWLDVPLGLRLWRVTRRALLGWGRRRPDMQVDCPEDPRLLPGFWGFVWRTRHSGRDRIAAVMAGLPAGTRQLRLTSLGGVRAFLDSIPPPVAQR